MKIAANSAQQVVRYRMGLDIDWRADFSEAIGAFAIDDRQLSFPKDIADGSGYFLEVAEGMHLWVADFNFHKEVTFMKVPSMENFYIVYYDLSEEISLHHVHEERLEVGYHAQLGMAVIDGSLESTYVPPVGQRMYSFQLLVSRKLMEQQLGNALPSAVVEKAFDHDKNTIFFYSHIHSRTKIALLALMERGYNDPAFEFQAKGTAILAFGHLLESMLEKEPDIRRISTNEIERVLLTQRYLMESLLKSFPGIEFLAEMASMSESKYKRLFKKILKDSPNTFFVQEKLLLAKKLLGSGKYSSINQVCTTIGYANPAYFASMYKSKFGNLPHVDFLKKASKISKG